MLFFEIKDDDAYKLEHLDIIMFPVGDKLVIGIFYRGQEMSTDSTRLRTAHFFISAVSSFVIRAVYICDLGIQMELRKL